MRFPRPHPATRVAWRFLLAPRYSRTVSVVNWVSVCGVVLGVAALIFTASVMNGFRERLYLALAGVEPHMRVLPQQAALNEPALKHLQEVFRAQPEVSAVAPYISAQVLLRAGNRMHVLSLRGVLPHAERKATEIERFIVRRNPWKRKEGAPGAGLEALSPAPGALPGILLGWGILRSLGVDIGDRVLIISPAQRLTPFGALPRVQSFRVRGVFRTGVQLTDDSLGYVYLPVLRRLLRRRTQADGLGLRLVHPQQTPLPTLRQVLPQGYTLRSWNEAQGNLFQVMRLEKAGVLFLLLLILFVSCFNIVASLAMRVLEKREAIAVLKSLGASNGWIARSFLTQGACIGALGALGGAVLGGGSAWLIGHFGLIRLPDHIFPFAPHLPVRILWVELLLLCAGSFFLCLGASLYPAWRAAQASIVSGLRDP